MDHVVNVGLTMADWSPIIQTTGEQTVTQGIQHKLICSVPSQSHKRLALGHDLLTFYT